MNYLEWPRIYQVVWSKLVYFKGSSLIRFAKHFRKYLEQAEKIIAFDISGEFPETDFKDDKIMREKFITEAGKNSISKKLEMIIFN